MRAIASPLKKKKKKKKKTRASWDYCYEQYTHGLYLSYQSHYRLLVKSIPPAILDPHENFGVVRVGSIRFNWPSTRLYATIVCTFQKQIIVKNTNGTWSESHTRRLNTISRVYTNGTTRPGVLKKDEPWPYNISVLLWMLFGHHSCPELTPGEWFWDSLLNEDRDYRPEVMAFKTELSVASHLYN